MRMVIDTNVLVRATPASLGGPAWETLKLAATGPHELISSQPLLLELADVLRRPQILRLHNLSEEEISRYVTLISQISVMVPVPPTSPAIVPNDPRTT